MTISKFASLLDQAATSITPVSQMGEKNSWDLEDAYKIQQASIELRKQRGETIRGFKLGFTSKAKMEQMGVHDLIWGILTNTMEVKNHETVDLQRWIHPRVEPEIAFRVSKNITTPISLYEIPGYIDGVAAALEIIDSRYENFKFSLVDVIADNCSSTGYVVGEWKSITTDIARLKIDLFSNHKIVESATSAAILDNPLLSVVELSRLASAQNILIEKGHIILAGAATAAIALEKNSIYSTEIESLGSVSFKTR